MPTNSLQSIDVTAITQNGVPISVAAALGDYEALTADATVGVNTSLVQVTPSGSDITITMPSVSTMQRECTIKIAQSYTGTKQVTVAATIDGVTNHVLSGAGDSIRLYPGTTEYKKV